MVFWFGGAPPCQGDTQKKYQLREPWDVAHHIIDFLSHDNVKLKINSQVAPRVRIPGFFQPQEYLHLQVGEITH